MIAKGGNPPFGKDHAQSQTMMPIQLDRIIIEARINDYGRRIAPAAAFWSYVRLRHEG